MTKDIYNKYVWAGSALFENIVNEFDVAVDEIVENRGVQLNDQEMDELYIFGYYLVSVVRAFILSSGAGVCFCVKTDPRPPAGAVVTTWSPRSKFYQKARHAFEAWAADKLTAYMIKARAYEDGAGQSDTFNIGENSKGGTTSTTTSRVNNTQTNSGNTRQRFQNGTATNTSGVANTTDTEETGTTSGQTSGTASSIIETPRRYDGDPAEWANAVRKYKTLFGSVRNSVELLFIDIENIDPADIITLEDLPADE